MMDSFKQSKFLGMTVDSPLGIFVDNRDNGASYVPVLSMEGYSFVAFNVHELDTTIKALKLVDRSTNTLARLSFGKDYCYSTKPHKKIEVSFAFDILYDFADVFMISDFSKETFESQLDSLLDTRLMRDEYRPIILELPSDLLNEEMDTLVRYSMLNRIDGLVSNSPRIIRHCHEFSKGRMPIIADLGKKKLAIKEVLDAGAGMLMTRAPRYPYFSWRQKRRLLNEYENCFENQEK